MNTNFDNLRSAWSMLTPEMQSAFTAQILAVAGQAAMPAVATAADDANDWARISDCWKVSGIDKYIISRAADNNLILDNGKVGTERRICLKSFHRWTLNRIKQNAEREPARTRETAAVLSPRDQRREALRLRYMGTSADDSVAELLQ